MTKLMMRNLNTARTRLAVIEAHAKSLHPLSPLGRTFALLKDGDRVISTNESLSEFDQIAILRQSESAYATIQSVLPNPTDDHADF